MVLYFLFPRIDETKEKRRYKNRNSTQLKIQQNELKQTEKLAAQNAHVNGPLFSLCGKLFFLRKNVATAFGRKLYGRQTFRRHLVWLAQSFG
jgi:hypothetical protein